MALFSTGSYLNRSDKGTYLPQYSTPDAAIRMMTEGHLNDLTIFESAFALDAQEIEAKQNGMPLTESQMEVLYEGFLGDVWNRIKELAKKIKDKISSIVSSFITKLKMICTSNVKDLVNKYKKQFMSADATNVRVKNWREPKKDNTNPNFADIANLWNKFKSASEEDIKKYQKEYNIEKCRALAIEKQTSYTSAEFKEEIMDRKFQSVETKDGFKSNEKTYIMDTLVSSSKDIKDIRDAERETNNALKEFERNANDELKAALDIERKTSPNDNSQERTEKAQRANLYLQTTNNFQTISGEWFGTLMAATKMNVAQCRRAFIAIATHKEKKEGVIDDDYLNVMMEASDYDVESEFDQFEPIDSENLEEF